MDKGIATRLRRAFDVYPEVHGMKVKVREVTGWENRDNGNTFDPKGGVNHHTAGHPTDEHPAPSLGICTFGRGGENPLSGPLCNVMFAPLNLTFYVIAAGAANHAGTPDDVPFHGMQFNGDAYGLEVEHDGLHPLEKWAIPVLARGWAAILKRKNIPARMLFQHWEWAPTRKIDLGTNFHGATPIPGADEFRSLVGVQKRKILNPWALQVPQKNTVLKVGNLDEVIEWQKQHKDKLQALDGLNLRPNI